MERYDKIQIKERIKSLDCDWVLWGSKTKDNHMSESEASSTVTNNGIVLSEENESEVAGPATTDVAHTDEDMVRSHSWTAREILTLIMIEDMEDAQLEDEAFNEEDEIDIPITTQTIVGKYEVDSYTKSPLNGAISISDMSQEMEGIGIKMRRDDAKLESREGKVHKNMKNIPVRTQRGSFSRMKKLLLDMLIQRRKTKLTGKIDDQTHSLLKINQVMLI